MTKVVTFPRQQSDHLVRARYPKVRALLEFAVRYRMAPWVVTKALLGAALLGALLWLFFVPFLILGQ